MTPEHTDPLNRLLADWARARSTDEARATRLASQVAEALRADTGASRTAVAADECELSRHQVAGGRRRCLVRGGLVLVVALVAASYVSTRFASPRLELTAGGGSASDSAERIPQAALLGDSALRHSRRLWEETSAVFDQGLAWLADGQREVALELEPPDGDEGADYVLLRIVVADRELETGRWRTVWQTDIVTRRESQVEVSSDRLPGSSLLLWTHAISPDELAVELDLTLEGAAPWRSESLSVLRPGRPTRADCARRNGSECCVFQTVVPLRS